MVGHGGWYDNQPYRDILFYVPFQQLLLIGPVVFFYTQSLLNPSFRLNRKAAVHFLPAALYLLFCVVMVVTDKLVLKRYYFLASGQDPDFDSWYQTVGFVSMATYLLLSLRYYRLFRRIMVQVIAYADKVQFVWMQNFLLAFMAMLSLKLLFFALSFFIPYDYSDSWWYFMAYALVFYYIAITGYGDVQETRVSFRPSLIEGKAALLLAAPTLQEAEASEVIDLDPEVANSAEGDPLVIEWKPRIEALMREERLFENPELSLSGMASRLKLPAAQLSRIINQGFGCNFNDFVNGYRVAAVKELLAAGEQQQQTLLGIAYDCGFNSKATFNRAFRKATGQNPSDYLRKVNG
jgi:AraC-like DNA-binding protein